MLFKIAAITILVNWHSGETIPEVCRTIFVNKPLEMCRFSRIRMINLELLLLGWKTNERIVSHIQFEGKEKGWQDATAWYLYVRLKNNCDQSYICSRDRRLSASWEPNSGHPLSPPYITALYRIEELKEGLNRSPIMSRDTSECKFFQLGFVVLARKEMIFNYIFPIDVFVRNSWWKCFKLNVCVIHFVICWFLQR